MTKMQLPESDQVLTWADPDELEPHAREQAARAATMPFVEKPLALMPDAHVGKGSTIGSVIATNGAIIPAAVGVDLGCGVGAARLPLTSDSLGDNLDDVFAQIHERVPAGIPTKGDRSNGAHAEVQAEYSAVVSTAVDPGRKAFDRAARQLGTLGSGNHFIEVCLDEEDQVWVVLHSGSRGVGNQLAQAHIKNAQGIMKQYFIDLPDPDLAYLVEGTTDFDAYIADMLWAQDYAKANRQLMLDRVVDAVTGSVGAEGVEPVVTVQCHHNYCEQENHHGRNVWVTRKGAIRARGTDLGIIPGSMATGSFIVKGKGNSASYESASHGAGRRMSRTRARKELAWTNEMDGITWNEEPETLLDEHPAAYKDIDDVMDRQSDLVDILHRLTPVLNFKGA